MERALPWLCLALFAASYRVFAQDAYLLPSDEGVERVVFGSRQEIAGLVVLAAAWIGWRRWRRLPPGAVGGAAGPAGAGLTLLGIGLFAWAHTTRSEAPLVASLASLLAGLACLARGAAGLRCMALPLAVLLLAIPPPPPLFQIWVWKLQTLSAELGAALLTLFGVSHELGSIQISRGPFHFLVIEPCSGLQGIATLTLMGILVRDLIGPERGRSWLVVALAPPLAFALNVVRVTWISLLDEPEAVGHTLQGLVLLGAGTLLLYGLGLAIPAAHPAPEPGPGARATFPWRVATGVGLLLLALSLLPPAAVPHRAQPPLDAIRPDSPAGWAGALLPVDRAFLGTLSIGPLLSRDYRRPLEQVTLCVGADVGPPSRSPFSPKTLLPGGEWRVEESGRAPLARLGRSVDVAVVSDGERRMLVYHWRFGDRGLLADVVDWLSGRSASRFADNRPRGFARLATPLAAGEADARARAERTLDRFLLAFAPALAQLGS